MVYWVHTLLHFISEERKQGMIKKSLSVWLSVMVLVFSSISIYADDVVRGSYFLKNIVIDGKNAANYELENPFLIYHDRLYIPTDEQTGKLMGFEAEMDYGKRILKIHGTDRSAAENAAQIAPIYDTQNGTVKNNLESVTAAARYDIEILAYAAGTQDTERAASVADSGAKTVDLGGLPVLESDHTVYIPLRAVVSGGVFGWSACYDACFGVCISTDPDIAAGSFYDAAQADRVRGLASYIMTQNTQRSTVEALGMVYYFETYGKINGVEPQLLMAVANCESMYDPHAVSSSGCVGLMQIKVSTGNSYGFTEEQLLEVKPNIEMGSIYLGEALQAFGGDTVRAVSSYNWGIWGVKSGSYNTRYAEKVLSKYDAIDSYLRDGGYI